MTLAPLIITVADIHNAVRGNIFKDPIALALTRVTNAKYSMLGWGYGRSYHDTYYTDWDVEPTNEITQFLKDWDSGRPVYPTVFNIRRVSSNTYRTEPTKVRRQPDARLSRYQSKTENNRNHHI